MTSAIWIIAVAAFLSAQQSVILAIVVAGIRSDDRAKNLTSASAHPHRAGHPPAARSRRPHRRSRHAAATPPGTTSSPVFPESDLP